jgi:hypothetical protein
MKGGKVGKSKKKSAAAVELGRLGGLKGGTARAKALDARRRSEIARRAAEARWQKRREDVGRSEPCGAPDPADVPEPSDWDDEPKEIPP